ncbi:MAG: DUF1294 domain-containing protein [bacterium]|jgi:uncharacterized membrane protein YsdA (DUF1294 family)|nr:DUF1294 domain-containing protein [bacterium]
MKYELLILLIYCGVLVFMSLITFFLFGKDKKMAQNGGGPKRIKEKILLGFCALGGAIGGFLGRIVFHHKTDKSYFSFTIYLGILVEAAALGFIAFIAFK